MHNRRPVVRRLCAHLEHPGPERRGRGIRPAARIWTADYTFINAQGGLVARAQRLANFASGATSVDLIDDERAVTVRVDGDMAVVQNLSTLRGRFSGRPNDGDLRGTFVWLRRGGRWRLATNQLTPVLP